MDPENPVAENLVTEKSTFLISSSKTKESEVFSPLVINSTKVQILGNNGKCKSSCSDTDSEKQSTTTEENGKGFRKYLGLLLALFSGAVFSLGALLIKLMEGYHPFSLAIYRFQGILLPSVPLIAYASCVQKQPVFEPLWPITEKKKRRTLVLVALRGALGCSAVFLHYYAIQYLNLADCLVIGSCTPIFVTVVAYIFLGEKCGVFPIVVAFIAIFGVGVITRPPILTGEEEYDSELLVGTGFALGSTFIATFAIILIRYLRNIHFGLITFVFGGWGTAQSIVCALIFGVFQIPKTTYDILLAVGIAGLNFLGQITFTLALQLENAGPVTLVRTLDVVFGFFWQFIFLSTEPDIYSITGAGIVIFGVLLAAFQKWITTLPENDPYRQRYWFVLR